MMTVRTDHAGLPVSSEFLSRIEIDRRLAWRNGFLEFSNQPAADVVAEFNRYNKQHISIADQDIGRLRISGNFEIGDRQSFILALQRVYTHLQIEAQPQPGGAILLSHRRSRTASRN